MRAAGPLPRPLSAGLHPQPTPAPLTRSSQFRSRVSEKRRILSAPRGVGLHTLGLPGLGKIKGARRKDTDWGGGEARAVGPDSPEE